MRPRQKVRQQLRNLTVMDGDVILLKANDDEHRIELMKTFDSLRHALSVTGRKKCIVVLVKDYNELSLIPEDEMKTYGWLRDPDYLKDEDETHIADSPAVDEVSIPE